VSCEGRALAATLFVPDRSAERLTILVYLGNGQAVFAAPHTDVTRVGRTTSSQKETSKKQLTLDEAVAELEGVINEVGPRLPCDITFASNITYKLTTVSETKEDVGLVYYIFNIGGTHDRTKTITRTDDITPDPSDWSKGDPLPPIQNHFSQIILNSVDKNLEAHKVPRGIAANTLSFNFETKVSWTGTIGLKVPILVAITADVAQTSSYAGSVAFGLKYWRTCELAKKSLSKAE
jgi:hypothetical protein